ncbi:MAG TPA: PIN domain-containing protein [Thermoanaerobaculia bacterium]
MRTAEQLNVTFVISTQVLQEFYATVTRKFSSRVPESVILFAMHDFTDFPTVQISVPVIFDAIELCRRFRLSFWDSLIVQAAMVAGCSRLLTEDLQHQMRIGDLVVENPFLDL